MSDFDNAIYSCVSSAHWRKDTPNYAVMLTTGQV